MVNPSVVELNLFGSGRKRRIYEEKEEYVLEKENIWGGNLFGQGWRRRIYEEKLEYVLNSRKYGNDSGLNP